MLRDFAKYRLFLIIREAFTSLLPIVLAMNSLVLLSHFTFPFKFLGFDFPLVDTSEINRLCLFLIPLFFNLSLSSLLAKEKELDQVGTMLISMVCFFRASGFIGINQVSEISSSNGSIIYSLLLSFVNVGILSFFAQFRILRLFKSSKNISPRLRKTFNLALPSLLTIISIELIKYAIVLGLQSNNIELLLNWTPRLQNLNDIQQLILYKTLALSTWLLGFHGEHTSEGIFQALQSMPAGQPTGIEFKPFHDVFMNIGGAGSTFVIPFIILLTPQQPHFKSIARLGVVFSLVNVNEILLFGLPIILNPVFFIPFFLAPFINMLIALAAINLGLLDFYLTPVHWMSPPLYSAYVASDGSPLAAVVQLVCIAADAVIYWPFLRVARQQYQMPFSLVSYLKKDAYGFLNEEINHYEERLFIAHQNSELTQITTTQKILTQLKGGTLMVYFQPKFSAQTLQLVGMEALLRLQDKSGKILPPTFLATLYRQGLSKAIDSKVIDLVFDQALEWQKSGFAVPMISINFDKDFLLDKQAIHRFINRSKTHKFNFYIEITEHTYTIQLKALATVIAELRHAGHRISIDDFGAGYSCLTSLLTLEADEIKLDRQLVAPPPGELERGQVLLKSSINLCHKLGFCVVAEGVETEHQLKFLQTCRVDIVQGYYLGKPMHPNEIMHLLRRSVQN